MKRSVRGLVCGVGVFGLAQSAVAADLDYLRGSEVFAPSFATYSNWSGFYVGAQGGFGLADAEFGMRAFDLLSTIVAATPQQNAVRLQSPSGALLILPRDNSSFTSFGGFAGYNAQWENVILGLEANYHRTSLDASAFAAAPTFRIAVSGQGNVVFNDIDASVTSRIRLTDYATIRARAGWAFGSFLPYATLGLAVGRADITNSALAHFTQLNSSSAVLGSFDLARTANQAGQFGLGYAVGLGVDWKFWSCFFLRAEYEFVEFMDLGDRRYFSGTEVVQRNLALNTVRAGVGYKF
jgi:opacity protein-like surface antigen